MSFWNRFNASNLRVVFQYLKSDFKKKKRSFTIGIISVFLVVFFICVLMNAIEMSPVIFLRLCEDQSGETDVILLPASIQNDASKAEENQEHNSNDPKIEFKLLNFNEIHDKLINESYIQGIVPRWIFQGNLTNVFNKWAISNIIMLDSDLENKYGLGRNLKLSNLHLNECYVTESIVKSLNLTLSDGHDNSDLEYINNNIDKLQNNNLTLSISLGSVLKVISNFNANNLIKNEAEENPKSTNAQENSMNRRAEKKLSLNSEKGIIFNQTDLYEGEKVFLDEEEQDYYNYFIKESSAEFNDSNKIELKNVSEAHKEKVKEIFQIRNLLKDLPLFNNLDFELDKYYEVFSQTEIFERIMKQAGIPKLIYSAFSMDFALAAIKNYLKFNKDDKLIKQFFNYNQETDEIKIKFPVAKENDKSKAQSNEQNQLLSKIDKAFVEFVNQNKDEIQDRLQIDDNKNLIKVTTNNNSSSEKLTENLEKLNSNLTALLSEYADETKNKNFSYRNFTLEALVDFLNKSTSNAKESLDQIDNKNPSFIRSISDLEYLLNSNHSSRANLDYNDNDKVFSKNKLFSRQEPDFISIKDKKVKINLRNLLQNLSDDDLLDLATFKINVHIKNVIKTESGKWPSLLGNTIAFDSKNAVEYINFNLAEKLKLLIKKNLNLDVDLDILLNNLNKTNTLNINEFTPTVNIILKDKFEIYKNDENNQRRKFAKITDNISKTLGLKYPMTTQIPLYIGFKIFNIVKIFLKNIFNSIIFFLWILSFMLVYSLILSNVDEKNYEFGMLRSLGFKKSNLISVIIFQSLMFSIPAIAVSLLMASLANIPVMLFFFHFAGIETNYLLTKPTLFLGVFAGLSLPLISSYFPVQKALASNLKDSLSIFNKKISDVSVSIVKLEKMGISPSLFLTSLILIVLGFLTYYVAPLSFLNMDFSTFLFILNAILIMMIIGLILLLQIFVPKIQKFILNILMLFFRKDRNLKFVIAKNLDGHFSRNQKASIMFMIALSFVIFAGCTILLICNFIVSASKNVFGSDIWVGQLDDNNSLDEKELVRYMTDFEAKFPGSIRNYTFVSMDMRDFLQTDIRLSTLNGYPDKDITFQGIDEKLVSTGFSELYFYSEYDKSLNFSKFQANPNLVDISSGLFLNKNISIINRNTTDSKSRSVIFPMGDPEEDDTDNLPDIPIIIAEGLRNSYSLNLENPAIINIAARNRIKIGAKVIALAIKIPGLPSFSSYNTIAKFAPVLTSMQTLKAIVEQLVKIDGSINERVKNHPAMYKTFDGIAKKYLLIQFHEGVNLKLKETVYYEIKNLMGTMTQSYFIEDFVQSSKKFTLAAEIFFIVIGFISVVLSFFLIMISFYSNIKDNLCEYGILRAIGLDQNQSLRVYLYEASVIMITSILLGTFIGMVISITLILQFNLFSEIPFQMTFPYKLYLFMCSSGLILALLGSYFPVKNVNELSLVKILKGVSD